MTLSATELGNAGFATGWRPLSRSLAAEGEGRAGVISIDGAALLPMYIRAPWTHGVYSTKQRMRDKKMHFEENPFSRSFAGLPIVVAIRTSHW